MDKATEIFGGISKSLEAAQGSDERLHWQGSPFAWILSQAPGSKGAIGAAMIEKFCEINDISVARSGDSDFDRFIAGKKVEVKMSTLWGSGIYKFQQLRDQDYEYLVCLGISPQQVHVWVMKKTQIPFADLPHQHGGAAGSDTWWLEVDPKNPPKWLSPFGPDPQRLLETFR